MKRIWMVDVLLALLLAGLFVWLCRVAPTPLERALQQVEP